MNHTHAITVLPMIPGERYFEVVQEETDPDVVCCYDTFGHLITVCLLRPLMTAVMALDAPCYNKNRWYIYVANGRVYVGRDNPSKNCIDWENGGLEL